MNIRTALIAVALQSFAALTHADRLTLPTDAPPAYRAECGSCHIAFPPQLLVAEQWRAVMATLEKHYGDNAALDETTRRTLEAFLVRQAGDTRRVGGAKPPATAGEPPRLTATPWFLRKHREATNADWRHAKVGRPANCAGCHTRAEQGSFDEREIVMPDGRRWED